MARELLGLPDAHELWEVEGRPWVVYRTPRTGTLFAYSLPVGIDAGALFDDREAEFDARLSREEADARGTLHMGPTTLISNTDDDPWDNLVHLVDRQARIKPWLKDPEVFGLIARAELEGRRFSESDVRGTDWWQERTEGERRWAEVALSDPQTAERQIESNRTRTRDVLVEMGYPEPPDSLTSYIADQFTRGKVSETQWRDMIRRETDPAAPDASPFAGFQPPPGAQAVEHDGRVYLRWGGRDYEMTGPGQIARYGGDPVPAPEVDRAGSLLDLVEQGPGVPDRQEPQFFVDNNDREWIAHHGVRYEATGPGARGAARALYGEPERVEPGFMSDFARGDDAVDAFGGPNRMEQVAAGHLVDPFTGRRVADPQPTTTGSGETFDPDEAPPAVADSERLGLGGEEEVYQLARRWLGPRHADAYGQDWVGEWAGRLRNNPESQDQLVDILRRQRKALYPEWEDENLTYEDIAGPWRAFAAPYYGVEPDGSEPWFDRLLRLNDPSEAEQYLRRKGREEGWAPVVEDALQGMSQALGGQARRPQGF